MEIAIKEDPTNAHYRHNRGLVYFQMHNYKAALEDFNEAIEKNEK